MSVYGISDVSRYVKIADLEKLKENEIYISASFAEKYDLLIGDVISLDEKYENKQYRFQIAGIYERCQSIAVFMPIENYRSAFDLEEDEFTGYLSDSELTDIAQDEIATVITERDITKMCDQVDHSMGAYMQYFQVLCILLSAADAGVAISDGAELAREIADITIAADDLYEIVQLKALSDALMKRIDQNYRRIVGFNTALILLGVGGILQPTSSAMLHNASTLLISLDSMRDL